MADAKPWTFTQLSGPKKSLTLTGYNAPFGRPRHSPVVTDAIELRRSERYYPGNDSPTRHVFGVRHEPWTLSGRWMDSQLGAGGANAMVATVKTFIRDAQPVTIAWGDIIAFTGLLVRLDPARESEAQVAWTLGVELDSDDTLPPKPPPPSPAQPASQVSNLLKTIDALPTSDDLPTDVPFPSSFLDSIDNVVAQINSVSASILSIANDIDNFERAASVTLNRLLGGFGQLQTALLTFQLTLDNAQNDFALSSAPSNSQIDFAIQREQARADALGTLAILAALTVQVEQTLGGRTNTTDRVTGNDSWESLAIKHYGSPAKADLIRQANQIRGGTKPLPGKAVHIPKA